MVERQVIWLQSTSTHFAAPCESCRAYGDVDGNGSPSHTIVEGTLRLVADVGWVSCRRGHRILVRRIARSPVKAVR